ARRRPRRRGSGGDRPRLDARAGRGARRPAGAPRRDRHPPADQAAAAPLPDLPSGGARGAAGLIRVLIAEDQGMVLGALAALLELEPDLEVVGPPATARRRWRWLWRRSRTWC